MPGPIWFYTTKNQLELESTLKYTKTHFKQCPSDANKLNRRANAPEFMCTKQCRFLKATHESSCATVP